MTFAAFFQALWGKEPFPWQEDLAKEVLAGRWPKSIGQPTAAGKTALIDIAVYALAKKVPQAPRRMFFVVDRRIIVDEAAKRAGDLAEKLAKADPKSELGRIAESLREIGDGNGAEPLEVATLRGGIPHSRSWTRSPRQPLVICSTVDQLGSSLLFRAYGSNNYMWPIRAALTAYDSLIILDEAHISQPFAETLGRVRQYAEWTESFGVARMTLVEMSATPREKDVFGSTDEDLAKNLTNEVLKGRWTASKQARLVEEEAGANENDFGPLIKSLTKNAREMRDQHGARVIGVIANRVGTARAVFESLVRDQSSDAILLTGRARPYDRDARWKEWSAFIELGHKTEPVRPIFVVSTQCIEVGANIDFGALVTEAASIDALEQRFGRLNRNGGGSVSQAVIAAQKNQTGAKAEDILYGSSLAATWRWLKAHIASSGTGKKKVKFVEMGVLALRKALRETPDRETLIADRKSAPILMPAHVDLLCQTSPEPAVSPEPSIFLHGPETGPADVQVIWRADLDEEAPQRWAEVVAICPPSAAEAISLPIRAVRKWLSQEQEEASDFGDMEGGPDPETRERDDIKWVLDWRGPDDNDSKILLYPSAIRPGATLIVPATYGGCDKWGWNPASKEPVSDVGDAVKLAMRRPILRLHPEIAKDYEDLAVALRKCETRDDARKILEEFSSANPQSRVFNIVNTLSTGRSIALAKAPGAAEWAAVTGRIAFDQSSSRSAYSNEPVCLGIHLTGCERWAERFTIGLDEKIRNTVVLAAARHDIGKADPRFQAWLRGGNPVDDEERLLAKSGKSGANSSAIERARVLAGYPKGGRHELLSIALILRMAAFNDSIDHDLLLHLVASHHGRCRPFAPVIKDREPVDVKYENCTVSSAHGLESVASGISERFWKLTRHYGWYGLAYLEMLLRLADHRQSEEEDEGNAEKCKKSS